MAEGLGFGALGSEEALLSGCPGEEGGDLSRAGSLPSRGGGWFLWTLREASLVFSVFPAIPSPERVEEKDAGGLTRVFKRTHCY